MNLTPILNFLTFNLVEQTSTKRFLSFGMQDTMPDNGGCSNTCPEFMHPDGNSGGVTDTMKLAEVVKINRALGTAASRRTWQATHPPANMKYLA
uniref:Uncharacterized protein n=1 Tax=Romanomermis culicivorax TaxID=13658 RepID=A0A915IFV5_ROMCU